MKLVNKTPAGSQHVYDLEVEHGQNFYANKINVHNCTGLKVPTIAIATAGGISVIQNTGAVRNSSDTSAFTQITLTPQLLTASFNNPVWYYTQNPNAVGASFGLQTNYLENARYQSDIKQVTKNRTTHFRSHKSRLAPYDTRIAWVVQSFIHNHSTPSRGITSAISAAFNAGYMLGDSRRALLASSQVGSVGPSTELVANGNFDVDATGWISGTNASVTISVANGQMTVSATTATTAQGAVYPITCVVGKTYQLKINVVSEVGGYRYLFICSSANVAEWRWRRSNAEVAIGENRIEFTAEQTTYYVAVGLYTVGQSITVDNVSVRECIPDRSYKAAGANIEGTLTAAAVASNASLVAYSGFSNVNYAREPYSADLDFGTGEWSVGAWINTANPAREVNLMPLSSMNGINSLTVTDAIGSDGSSSTAKLVIPTTAPNYHRFASIGEIINPGYGNYFWISVVAKAKEITWLTIVAWGATTYTVGRVFDLLNGTVAGGQTEYEAFVSPAGNGFYRCSVRVPRNNTNALSFAVGSFDAGNTINYAQSQVTAGDGVSGYYVESVQVNYGDSLASAFLASAYRNVPAPIVDRAYSTGPKINLGIDGVGKLTATAYDGTTTRTVTTPAAYNTGTWTKVRATYTTDGTLSIMVNGVNVASTTGAPLLTLNNSNAVLTIGNSYALDAPFPGSISLLKFSATVPTQEQALWMYEQEKQLFREGAQCVLPSSGNVLDLAYDDETDTWSALQATHESTWSGLVRTSTQTPSAGSFAKCVAGSGTKLLARTTTNPGVDIQMPNKNLKSELSKKSETAMRLSSNLVTFDYVGGFTATTSANSTSITSVSGLSYPTSYIGAVVTGSGIPASTTITNVSGTTIYLSNAATASASGVQISFTDFVLPVGYEAKTVMSAGVIKQEGSTKDWQRLYDGFKETIRFGTAPGYTTWVSIQAERTQS